MALMSPLDAGFLMFEARERPLHAGGLQVFETPDGAGRGYLRDVYEDGLTFREVRPLFSRKPARALGIGPWSWVEDTNLDLEYHVRHSALPRPAGMNELTNLVSRLHGSLLDRTRPLWESHLIEGLDQGRFAVYTKIHHALVDGVSAMGILQDALSTDADERDMPPPWVPRSANRPRRAAETPADSPAALLRGLVGGTFGSVEVLRRMASSVVEGLEQQSAALPFQAPRTILNTRISGARRFAGASWPLERLRQVAKAVDGTINDVVLAMSAGALRRYLLAEDALPDQPLVAMVPVSMRADGAGEGNSVGMVLAVLGTHVEDPVDRFTMILDSIRRAKAHLQGLSTVQAMALNVLPVAPFLLAAGLRVPEITRPPFNVVISNIPGPRETRYWNGARLQTNYPVSIPVDGQALNITCTSYDGEISFGLVGCRRSVPGLDRMLGFLDLSLTELEDALT